MRLLLDSHALIWTLADDPALRADAREQIRDSANLVVTSVASVWEIAIKQALGKLHAPSDIEVQLAALGVAALPITLKDALAAAALPLHHRDPFDRMLVAQAFAEGLTLVTRDRRLAEYGVPILAA